MAYSQLTTRTTSDANAAADINQLQANIEALKGGAASAAPVTTLADVGGVSVDGVGKKLLWKTITGTTDSDGVTNAAHGLTRSKILFIQDSTDNTDGSSYSGGVSTVKYIAYNDTDVIIYTPDAAWYAQPYKVTIAYTD